MFSKYLAEIRLRCGIIWKTYCVNFVNLTFNVLFLLYKRIYLYAVEVYIFIR